MLMPQQLLQGAHVHAVAEHEGGGGMPELMGAVAVLLQPRFPQVDFYQPVHRAAGDALSPLGDKEGRGSRRTVFLPERKISVDGVRHRLVDVDDPLSVALAHHPQAVFIHIAEVEAHISDPNYSVVQLSAAVGMTRGTLYKKLMAIVGKSPVEFIRIVRLKRGKALLDQGRTNISEVADSVGFSPKMFAQHFREMYGETPSDYLKRKKSNYTDYVESKE